MAKRIAGENLQVTETVGGGTSGTGVAEVETVEHQETRLMAALPDMVKAAIAAGDVASSIDEVKIGKDKSPTGKDEVSRYVRLSAMSAKGQLALCNGKMVPSTPKPEEGEDERTEVEKADGACDYFNYGYDLNRRAEVRQALSNILQGPEKAIKKAVDGLVANGGFTAEEAREIVVRQRMKVGLAV